MKTPDVIIVGGGIAGLAVAHPLARAGASVTLLEREPLLAAHSSGRNAAIFRLLDASRGVLPLAVRSMALLDSIFGARGDWLRPTGSLFVAAQPASIRPLLELARANGVAHEELGADALVALAPALAGGQVRCGVRVRDDGIIDIHGLATRLADEARRAGAVLRTRCEVAEVQAAGGRAAGVRLASGEVIEAGRVVIAGGAWAARLGETAGAPLPLTPMRRHIALLEARELRNGSPVVWCVDEEAYFRPESGGALCSPCDEEQWEPCIPPASPRALELLADKFARIAPGLAEAGVRRSWACLRTFAPDRALVAGEDPRVAGLFWLAGLGGHGMTAGVGAGELVAGLVRGEPHPLAEGLSPARLLRGAGPSPAAGKLVALP